MLFNVITALVRPEYLNKILDSLVASRASNPVHINWIIVVDVLNLAPVPAAGYGATIQKISDRVSKIDFIDLETHTVQSTRSPANVGFDNCKDGLVCLIDDDNIMHPNYITEIYKASQAMKIDDYGFLYNQILGKKPNSTNQRIRRIIPYKVGPSRVDTAQITLTKKLLGKSRWPNRKGDMSVTCPDGVFIGRVYNAKPNKFQIIGKSLCYYNYLKNPGLDFS